MSTHEESRGYLDFAAADFAAVSAVVAAVVAVGVVLAGAVAVAVAELDLERVAATIAIRSD